MSDKYTIKNCPCRMERHEDDCFGHTGYYNCCACTDCVLKQIAEKCRKEIRVYRKTVLPNDGINTLHFGRQSFAYDILRLLDIQEVE